MWWIELGVRLATMTAARWCLPYAARGLGGRPVAQSTVEYALVGALVVIAAAGALALLGGQLSSVFTNITNTLRTASAGR
jgi:Flp pilus assembly pilin Flp